MFWVHRIKKFSQSVQASLSSARQQLSDFGERFPYRTSDALNHQFHDGFVIHTTLNIPLTILLGEVNVRTAAKMSILERTVQGSTSDHQIAWDKLPRVRLAFHWVHMTEVICTEHFYTGWIGPHLQLMHLMQLIQLFRGDALYDLNRTCFFCMTK
ncbi:hypothetical protein D3C86_1331710 [compost metagenome]